MSDEKKNETPAAGKRKIVRSPNSPGLSLSDALAKAKIIYDAEKTIPTTSEVMLGHLGYENVDSGRAGRTFSALRQYGLITEGADGKFRISDSSFRYFELPKDDPERQTILRQAAVKPALFKELITRHKDGALPSDAALRSYLVLEKSFNPNTVEDVIRVFRRTIAVAKPFVEGYTEPEAGAPSGESKPAGETPMQPPAAGNSPVKPSPAPQFVEFRNLDGSQIDYEKCSPKRTELAFKLSRSSEARVVIYGDASQEAITKLGALLDLQKDTFPTQKELEAPRLAVWKNKDHDQPVTVVGDLGQGPDGKHYVKIAESVTGVPADEIDFEAVKTKGAA